MADIYPGATLIITVLLAYFGVQRSLENGLKLQRERLRDELRTELYKKVADIVHSAASAVGRATTSTMVAVGALEMNARGAPLGSQYSGQDLANSHVAALSSVTQVLIAMDQYEIAFLRFRSIRRALAEGHRQLLDSYVELGFKLSTYLPIRLPGPPIQEAGPLIVPTSEQLIEARLLREEYGQVCSDVSAYLQDLQVEMQNELLSNLFEGRSVPARKPQDPNAVVLKRDDDHMVERPEGHWV